MNVPNPQNASINEEEKDKKTVEELQDSDDEYDFLDQETSKLEKLTSEAGLKPCYVNGLSSVRTYLVICVKQRSNNFTAVGIRNMGHGNQKVHCWPDCKNFRHHSIQAIECRNSLLHL